MKIALVLLAACGHAAAPAVIDNGGGAPPVTTAAYHAQVFRSCGPTDGPATTVLLTHEDFGCDQQRVGAHVRIELWGAGRPSGAIDLASGGWAQQCASNDYESCVSASAAAIDWGASTFSLTLPDGSAVSGEFAVKECDVPMLCG